MGQTLSTRTRAPERTISADATWNAAEYRQERASINAKYVGRVEYWALEACDHSDARRLAEIERLFRARDAELAALDQRCPIPGGELS